jgi:hypothetical protein
MASTIWSRFKSIKKSGASRVSFIKSDFFSNRMLWKVMTNTSLGYLSGLTTAIAQRQPGRFAGESIPEQG